MAGQDISEKALMIKPSATFAVQQKVKELNARGRQVIGFGLGEPDFPVPQAIKDSIAQALADRKTKYVPIAGIPELRQAIADKLKADNNLDYSPEQVIVSTGAKQALFNAMSALLNPGDEVLIPVPYWTSYPEMVAFCDGKPVFVPTRDFMPDTDSVEKAITRRTKLLIINSPNNPSGAVISKKNMKALAELAADKGLWVISDEIYEKIIYEGSHVSFGSLDRRAFEKTITINGFSKSYAMTGLRLGYAAGPKKVIQAMANIQGQVTSNATSIVQYGALSAFSQTKEVEAMVAEFRKRRDFVVKSLKRIHGVKLIIPEGAFYAFPDVSAHYNNEVQDSTAFTNYLLEKALVAAVPGQAFGCDANVRISYAASMDMLKEGMRRISEVLG